MALSYRTIDTPGGPVLSPYDPDAEEADRLAREQQAAEATRRALTDATVLSPPERDRPLNIEPAPVADSVQPAPIAAAVAPPSGAPASLSLAPSSPASAVSTPPVAPSSAPAADAAPADDSPQVTQDSNFKEVIVDPLSGSAYLGKPTEQEQKAERAASFDAREAALSSEFASTMNMDPTLMTDEQRVQLAAKQGELHRQLNEMGLQRQAEAGNEVAQQQLALQKQAERELALKQRDAEIQKRAIDTEVKFKQQKLDAMDEEAANTKVDRSWGGGSTGRAVLLGVMAAISGLGSALKGQGDRNPALDIIMKGIDERVADQFAQRKAGMENRAKQRSRLDAYRDSSVLTIDQQMAASRIALMKQTAAEMEQVASTLPAAKKAAVTAAAKQLREDALSERGKLDKRFFEETKFKIEQAEKERAARADEANARRAVGATYARIGEDRRQFDVLDKRYNSEEAVASRKADRDKTLAEIEKLKAEASGDAAKLKSLQAQEAALKLQAAQDDQTVKAMEPSLIWDEKTGDWARNSDGTLAMSVGNFKQPDRLGGADVTLKGNETERRQVRDQLAAVGTTLSVIDDLVAHIATHGWESDTIKSDAWMKAHALMTQLQLEGKDVYQLGALAGPDMAILSKLFGGDPTRAIGDPTVSLRTARKGLEEAAFRRFSQKSDYKGTLDDFHTPERNKYGVIEETKNTPSEGLLQRSKARGAGLGTKGDALAPTPFYLEENPDLATGDDPRGYPSQDAEDAIRTLAEQAASKDKTMSEPAKVALKELLDHEKHGPARRFIARELRRTRADLGIPQFNAQSYDAYDIAERAAGGRVPGIPGAPTGLVGAAQSASRPGR